MTPKLCLCECRFTLVFASVILSSPLPDICSQSRSLLPVVCIINILRLYMMTLAPSISLKLHLLMMLESSFTIITCLQYRPLVLIGLLLGQKRLITVVKGFTAAALQKFLLVFIFDSANVRNICTKDLTGRRDFTGRSLHSETFYCRNLRIFVISQTVRPWQAFPVQSNVCGQGQGPTLEWSTSKVVHLGRLCLTHKHQTRLERLSRDKHSSLLRKSVIYGRKQFIVQAPGASTLKLSTELISYSS